MRITVGDEAMEVGEGTSLDDLLRPHAARSEHMIAVLNDRVVKRHRWAETRLGEGDRVDLISLVGGG
jgi:sulfur carrier protein